MAQNPAIVTQDKMSVIIAECPPGNRPPLHAHHQTKETFFLSRRAVFASAGVMRARTRFISIPTT